MFLTNLPKCQHTLKGKNYVPFLQESQFTSLQKIEKWEVVVEDDLLEIVSSSDLFPGSSWHIQLPLSQCVMSSGQKTIVLEDDILVFVSIFRDLALGQLIL